MKKAVLSSVALAGVILFIPSILVTVFSDDEEMFVTPEATVQSSEAVNGKVEKLELEEYTEDGMTVSVYRSQTEGIDEVPLESYIVGVVASEMPASFEMEALKAQALTARTYIYEQLLNSGDIHLPNGADVTDTVTHQVYKSKEELKEEWEDDYNWKIARIKQAVFETGGEVITYEGEPITASFFSTSNGYTENAHEYWENEIPYLQTVESPWDTESPRFENEQTIHRTEIEEALGVRLPEGNTIGEIRSQTSGERVDEVVISGQTFSGRDVREALELDSSDFTWVRDGDEITITTKGWGHGVGMSQYGADGMAKEGHSYQDIIHYYYEGVDIKEPEESYALLDE
ncbi:stage II sporulation protein D [Texcoconibacillus texcoconensis]